MAYPENAYILVADIGGTNTRVALADGTQVLPKTVRRYKNADHAGLESVLRRYIADEDGVDPMAACVAVAGPVRDGVAAMTNLDWSIDRDALARATQAETVAILNDLQAQGHALQHLDPAQCQVVLDGPEPTPGAARLVIGVGTGFNAAPVFMMDGRTLVPPSESGHANLPIRNEAELRLCQFVETAHGFPAVEDVLSGRGLERVYHWLGHEANEPQQKLAAEIMQGCADASDPRAQEAVRLFIRILGTVAGNIALIQLPFGGVYLVGGVARAMSPYLRDYGFGDAFRDKGRFAGFMKNFGVRVVEDDYAALTGCAAHIGEVLAKQG